MFLERKEKHEKKKKTFHNQVALDLESSNRNQNFVFRNVCGVGY